jgi:dTMP kinase
MGKSRTGESAYFATDSILAVSCPFSGNGTGQAASLIVMFITLEGSEGSGKTTQIPFLSHFLRDKGYEVISTREPGGTLIGDQIRSILASLENTAMGARTEALLFMSARAQLVDEVILPHLDRGGVVISDRYADSTLAYQGYGRGLDRTQLRVLLDFATRRLKPSLTLLLDLDVEEGLRRRARGGEWNRLDACEIEFYERVRQGYLELVQAEPDRWVVIDAGRPLEDVRRDICKVVLGRLKQRT